MGINYPKSKLLRVKTIYCKVVGICAFAIFDVYVDSANTINFDHEINFKVNSNCVGGGGMWMNAV